MTKTRISSRISNWFNLSKQYFFTYKEGFFNLSFLSNSPELLVKSTIKMPFVKHNKEKQQFIVDTPFLKGNSLYAELEKGLWVLHSDMFYKNNVSFTPIYDDFLPSNYYCIAVNFTESSFDTSYFTSNNVTIKNQSISLIHPKGDSIHCHFKGSKTKMYIVYFSKEWLQKNILLSSKTSKKTKMLFENPAKKFVNYTYENRIFNVVIKQFSKLFSSDEKPNLLELKKQTFIFFDLFFKNLEYSDGFEIKDLGLKSNLKIKNIERYLNTNIHEKFPGIEYLSEKFKISPTKLKKDFKQIYNTTIFKYFQNKQMAIAASYLNNDMLVKDVAEKFKYENVSKFSNAFKKYNGELPSHFKK